MKEGEKFEREIQISSKDGKAVVLNFAKYEHQDDPLFAGKPPFTCEILNNGSKLVTVKITGNLVLNYATSQYQNIMEHSMILDVVQPLNLKQKIKVLVKRPP